MKKIYLLTFIIGISLLNACKKHDVTESNSIPTFQNYNRQKLLENIGENIIIPAYQAFYDASNNLCTATSNFKTNPTLNTLDSLQWAWKQTESAWKLCELYNFGPASNITAGYYSSIDYHSIDTLAINNCIYSSDKIDSSYIASKGSTIKGLLALEYLLFDRTNGNTAILKKYTPVNYIINQRKDFLFSSAINIKGKAKDLLNAWKSTSGNYIASFISMDGNDINSSLGLLTNQLLYLTDIVKDNRINVPLGLKNGTAHPNSVEAAQSEKSIDNIRDNIKSIENTFLGKGKDNTDSIGYDDLLDYLNIKTNDTLLSQKIKLQFKVVNNALNNLTPPLQSAITNNPDSVTLVSTELKKLLALLKTNMTIQALNITITFSFNDSDGD